ncbi:Uma2 family endonuclease [Candidatus Poribacteria bacterium]|nr:Uma2 family endonuclease [Candidatus Poribacteria bacterium]
MSSIGARTHFTPAEYLVLERKAIYKSEYINGEIFAMSGATLTHNLITVDIATELNILLRESECRVVTNDLRVRTSPDVSYFYPDVIVYCDEPKFEDDSFDTLLNPVIIMEVLSPSTEEYDRNEKFEYYKRLSSLKEYILVAQDKISVEHYVIRGADWEFTTFEDPNEFLTLSTIKCNLPLKNIYRRVDL